MTTLAILFVDVSDSTRLYERLGDTRARSVVARYIDLLKRITTACGGRVIKTIGDEVMCTFPTADDAAMVSTQMQEEIAELGNNMDVKLSVRIGFHFGQVIDEDDDVFGDAVNLAARITGQTKAGQIITSGETLKQLAGKHRCRTRFVISATVKGKQKPVELHELTWEAAAELTLVGIQPLDLSELSATGQRCDVVFDGHTHRVTPENGMMTLGRGLQNTLVVPHRKASRVHARIEHRRGRFFLLDQSTNGTYIVTSDGERMRVHREELALTRTGAIGLGEELDFDASDAVRYTCIG